MVSGNPRDSAIATQNQTNIKQTNLSNAVGGSKRKRNRKGGADTSSSSTNQIVVPQFTMQYQPTGGPGQDPNSIIQQNSQTSTQANANAVYDKYATQKGGIRKTRHKKKVGGNKYSWGCYSGGRKRSHKRSKKNRRRQK